MKRLSDRLAMAVSTCPSLDQLEALVANAAADLGFDHYALVEHRTSGCGDAGLLRIHNYPAPWAAEILERGYAADDPVHLASQRSSRGFSWQQLGRLIRMEPRHSAILARSKCHGLGTGFTVPANVPGAPSASCSFAVRRGQKLPHARLSCAELVGAFALEAARRLVSRAAKGARPHLSRREVECLRLVARGKTDWEIATILGLSPETVRQYLKRARAAYDVVTRTQLVVRGLHDDWISFDEAIPHGGGMG